MEVWQPSQLQKKHRSKGKLFPVLLCKRQTAELCHIKLSTITQVYILQDKKVLFCNINDMIFNTISYAAFMLPIKHCSVFFPVYTTYSEENLLCFTVSTGHLSTRQHAVDQYKFYIQHCMMKSTSSCNMTPEFLDYEHQCCTTKARVFNIADWGKYETKGILSHAHKQIHTSKVAKWQQCTSRVWSVAVQHKFKNDLEKDLWIQKVSLPWLLNEGDTCECYSHLFGCLVSSFFKL